MSKAAWRIDKSSIEILSQRMLRGLKERRELLMLNPSKWFEWKYGKTWLER